ncbi:hypothetical protein [Streptomyces sp. NPDC058545]|uniref:hypothetical protein n=1 Tax=Streptomyces sp. NPDC058545 TaxID=3346544 RepID=UPI00364895A0
MTSRMTVRGLGRLGRIAGSAAPARGTPIRPPTTTGPPSWTRANGAPTGAGCAAPTGPAPGGRLPLTAAPEKSGNGKKTPVTITAWAGTPSPMTTWTYGAHGSVVNDVTARRPYTPGGHGPGHRVELRHCTGEADQRWDRAAQRDRTPAGRAGVTVTQR